MFLASTWLLLPARAGRETINGPTGPTYISYPDRHRWCKDGGNGINASGWLSKQPYLGYVVLTEGLPQVDIAGVERFADDGAIRAKLAEHIEMVERGNAARYDHGLRNAVTIPWQHPDCWHVYNQYTIQTPRRDLLRAHLTQAGVGSEVYYPVPLHRQKCFAHLGYQPGDFPLAERTAAESLSLPIFPELTNDQLDYVIDSIVRFR